MFGDETAERAAFGQVVVDVGRFDSEVDAARAYDRAAVWCLGLTAQTNFPVSSLIQVDLAQEGTILVDAPYPQMQRSLLSC